MTAVGNALKKKDLSCVSEEKVEMKENNAWYWHMKYFFAWQVLKITKLEIFKTRLGNKPFKHSEE